MGKVTVVGGSRATTPVTGTPLGDLSVGSSIYLKENGSSVEYLIVNQGIPSNSSLYDSSCNGTWLLRKDICASQTYGKNNPTYATSYPHSYLNGDFLNLFDVDIQNIIKQVKIPYVNVAGGDTPASGSNGLSTKIFILSCYEVGWTKSTHNKIPEDGACLEYFVGATNAKRIAYSGETADRWWLRSPSIGDKTMVWAVFRTGEYSGTSYGDYSCVRPALILPSTVRVKKDGTIKV